MLLTQHQVQMAVNQLVNFVSIMIGKGFNNFSMFIGQTVHRQVGVIYTQKAITVEVGAKAQQPIPYILFVGKFINFFDEIDCPFGKKRLI